MARLIALLLAASVSLPSASAYACAGGPRSFHWSESAIEHRPYKGDFRFFRGKVLRINTIHNFAKLVTFQVVEALSEIDGIDAGLLKIRATFGNHGGGCGQMLSIGDTGTYAIQERVEGRRLASHLGG